MHDRYRLLTFDLDDTLWPCQPTIDAAETVFYRWLQTYTPRLTAHYDLDALRLHRREIFATHPEIAHDMTAIRNVSLQLLLTRYGYKADWANHAVKVFCQYRQYVTPYPEVLAVLKQLRSHFCLISLTNGNAEVAQTPLRDCFDYSLTAADVGAAKPDPRLLTTAMAWARTTAQATLHIGDDPQRDILAAQQLGIDSVWVNRHAVQWPHELQRPTFEIQSLTALWPWLQHAV
jgi:putative hydrolase of the HAD superfamily